MWSSTAALDVGDENRRAGEPERWTAEEARTCRRGSGEFFLVDRRVQC